MEKLRVEKLEATLVGPTEKVEGGFYFLSNLDQNVAVIMQTILCYEGDERGSENAGAVIKEGLSKVLKHFYPLAGRLTISFDGKLVVQCTGEGVPFVEAVADCGIQVLGDITVPDPVMLGKLVHTFPHAKSLLEIPLLTVQVTRFKCGGFVVGTAMNHCMVDGISVVQFQNSWAETARGVMLTVPPFLDRSILKSRQPPKVEFSHNEFAEIEDISDIAVLYQEQEMSYRSFCFNKEMLTQLKRTAMEDGSINNCSTFTLLTALVWRARSRALKMDPLQQTKLLFAVDGRSRFDPPLPKGFFGNGIVLACCLCSAGELVEKPLSFAIKLVQEAIKLVGEDFIKSAIDYFEVTRARPSLTGTLLVTTWAGLPFKSVDFGWGKAKQSGPATLPEKEMAVFLPHGEDGKGIKLLLGLPASVVELFQELIKV